MAISENAFPNTVSAEVKEIFTKFMHLSNAASSHTEHEKNEQGLAALFTEEGVYRFAEQEGKGPDGIYALREKLFGNVPHRDHSIIQIYTWGSNDLELMALGSVSYKFHDGTDHQREWSGRYSLVKSELDELKFRLVQIFINPVHDEEK